MIVLILIIKLHFALAPTNGKRYMEWMMPGDSTRLVIFLHCHLDAIWLATTRRALRPLISPAHSTFTPCCDLWITNLVYFGKKKSFIIHISVVGTRFGVPEHLHLTLVPDLLTYGNVNLRWIANWWLTPSSPPLTLGHEGIEPLFRPKGEPAMRRPRGIYLYRITRSEFRNLFKGLVTLASYRV